MFASTYGAAEVIATALQRAYIKTTNKQSASFVPAIVSKHIMSRENVYCFIFPQALELQPPKLKFEHSVIAHPDQF